MKNILILVTINLILPAIVFLITPSLLITTRQGYSSDTGDNLISFLNSNPITFDFNSDLDNFHHLTLWLKNPSISNNSRIIVDIKSPSASRSLVFYGSNVGDPGRVPLKFPPFNEKAGTNYLITLTTDNTVHDSLYIIADYQNNPLFQTFYRTSNFKQNLLTNINRQFKLLKNRSQIHNFAYFMVIISLNLSLILIGNTKKHAV